MKILIRVNEITEVIELNETGSAKRIYESLPLKGHANTWGEEIYFSIGISLDTEKGKEEVNVGDVAYWPPGNAFCIFFGITPASKNEKPRAASKVNVIGKVAGDSKVFKKVKDGDNVYLEALDDL